MPSHRPQFALAAGVYRYRLLTINSSKVLTLCGAGGLAVGSSQEAVGLVDGVEQPYTTGRLFNVTDLEGELVLEAGGAATAGDLGKCGANGKIVVEASAATKTVDTLGVFIDTSSGDTAKVRFAFGE
jgi:hypothetical protein